GLRGEGGVGGWYGRRRCRFLRSESYLFHIDRIFACKFEATAGGVEIGGAHSERRATQEALRRFGAHAVRLPGAGRMNYRDGVALARQRAAPGLKGRGTERFAPTVVRGVEERLEVREAGVVVDGQVRAKNGRPVQNAAMR